MKWVDGIKYNWTCAGGDYKLQFNMMRKKPSGFPWLLPHFQGQSPGPEYQEGNVNTSPTVFGQLKRLMPRPFGPCLQLWAKNILISNRLKWEKKRAFKVLAKKKKKEIQIPVRLLPISCHSFNPIIRSPVTSLYALSHLSAAFWPCFHIW